MRRGMMANEDEGGPLLQHVPLPAGWEEGILKYGIGNRHPANLDRINDCGGKPMKPDIAEVIAKCIHRAQQNVWEKPDLDTARDIADQIIDALDIAGYRVERKPA